MAGFLVAWTQEGMAVDPAMWSQARSQAVRAGELAASYEAPGCAVLAWHRGSGEFPHSGKLYSVAGKQVAWVGQCLDDAGDASDHAMHALASTPWSDAAVAHLNGPFAAVVVGAAPRSVQVITDRYRHYPVYLWKGAQLAVASTDLGCLLPFMPVRAMNLDAVDMLLRCGELIDRMTLLQGVELLPPGTVLDASGASPALRERRYWSMRHDGSKAGRLEATAADLAERLTTAVQRVEAATPRLGITLSGGLDSRIILDLCRHPERVPSFTWGLPGCRDIACAAKYARVAGSPHTVKHWEPEAFPPLWSRGVALTAGAFGIESMHMMPYIGLLAGHCDVVLNGLAGDAILGGNFMKYDWLAESDIAVLGRSVWRWRVSEAEDRLVDGLRVPRNGGVPAGQQWAQSIAAREGARPIERVNDWLYENRVFRNTNSGTMLLRSGVESHSPFFDRDFLDAVIAVKQDHKFKHRLYLEVMQRAAPRAASVTWQRTQIPPAWGYRANFAAMALHRMVGKLAAPWGIEPFKALKVADPAGWLRAQWRNAVQSILFSPKAMQRGLWDVSAAQALWRAHLDGANHTRQIGAMVAIELFAQQALDGAA